MLPGPPHLALDAGGGIDAPAYIGAVNLANLLLIRANGRMKETAVRQALGATRPHMVREAIVETTLLTWTGGLLGLGLGVAGIRLLAVLLHRLATRSASLSTPGRPGPHFLGLVVLGWCWPYPLPGSSS